MQITHFAAHRSVTPSMWCMAQLSSTSTLLFPGYGFICSSSPSRNSKKVFPLNEPRTTDIQMTPLLRVKAGRTEYLLWGRSDNASDQLTQDSHLSPRTKFVLWKSRSRALLAPRPAPHHCHTRLISLLDFLPCFPCFPLVTCRRHSSYLAPCATSTRYCAISHRHDSPSATLSSAYIYSPCTYCI